MIVSDLLVSEFGRAIPEYTSSVPGFLSTGNNVEKLNKWKVVERCIEERLKEDEPWGHFKPIMEGWVNLLYHTLLDTNVSR